MQSFLTACLTGVAAAAFGCALAAPAPAGSAAPAAATVHIKDFKFAPASLSVHAGDTVTFVNDDDEAHTIVATDKSFASQGLDTGTAWKHTFSSAGTFAYFCGLHPYMKATIVVLPSGSAS